MYGEAFRHPLETMAFMTRRKRKKGAERKLILRPLSTRKT